MLLVSLVKNNEVVIGARLFFSTVQCYVGFSFLGERHARWRIGIEEKRTAQFVGERESECESARGKDSEIYRDRIRRERQRSEKEK